MPAARIHKVDHKRFCMHSFHLGIDVAKAKLDCTLRLPDGKIRHKVVSNTPAGFGDLLTFLSRNMVSDLHVCMEATGVCWEEVAEFLSAQQGVTVSVINPAQIEAFGASRMVRSKTDKIDATLITVFCQERSPVP